MLLCALLKSFKIFFLSTALFQSSGVVFKDVHQRTVAVSYSLKSSIHAVDSQITVVKDPAYSVCVASTRADYSLYTPKAEIKVKLQSRKKARRPVKRPSNFSVSAPAKLPVKRPSNFSVSAPVKLPVKRPAPARGLHTHRSTISQLLKQYFDKQAKGKSVVKPSNSSVFPARPVNISIPITARPPPAPPSGSDSSSSSLSNSPRSPHVLKEK